MCLLVLYVYVCVCAYVCMLLIILDFVPASPANVLATASSTTSVDVSWTPPPNLSDPITHYKLYYYNINDGAFEFDTNVTETRYTVTGLLKFSRYGFRIVAFNKNGPGVSSDEVTCRTLSDGELKLDVRMVLSVFGMPFISLFGIDCIKLLLLLLWIFSSHIVSHSDLYVI